MVFGLQDSITEFLTLSVFKFHFQGSGYISFVHFGDKTVSSSVPCTTKKQAEQLAAREALLAIGVNDPENAFRNKGSRKNKSKRTLTSRTEFKRTWVHSHGGQGPQLDAWYALNSHITIQICLIAFSDSFYKFVTSFS